MTQGNLLDYSNGSDDQREKYRVGTLEYTKAGLIGIFGWLIWGNLCFHLFESSGGPGILKLYLQDNFHISNLQADILFSFIPSSIGTVMTPIISFRSDRTRSRLGRRIPYILYTAPFLVLFAIAIGFSDNIIAYCKSAISPGSFISPFTAALIIIGLLTIGFVAFNEFVSTVYYYLLPDVMPRKFLGRFQATSMILGSFVSIFINLYIAPYKLTHIRDIHVGVAILYFVGFGVLCWRVKEGQYPPVEDLARRTPFIEQVRLYFVESFSHPIFILFYLATAAGVLSKAVSPAGIFSLHLSEHQSTLIAANGKPAASAISLKGDRSLTGGSDGVLRYWDTSVLAKPRLLKTMHCDLGAITSIAMSHNGHLAVVGGGNGNAEIWDLASGETISRFLAHAGGVNSVAIAPNDAVFASAGEDKMVATWDMTTGARLHTMAGHKKQADCVAFNSTGSQIVSGGADKRIIIWNARTGARLTTLEGSPGPVYAVAFMPALGRVVTPGIMKRGIFVSGARGFAHYLHNVFTNESLYDPSNPPTSKVIGADAWIISGGRDGATDNINSKVRIWDIATATILEELKGHKRAITSVLYKPDLRLVLSGSLDSSIRAWKPMDISSTADDQSFKTFSGYTHAITSVAAADLGVPIINASKDGSVHLWNIDQGISLEKGGLRGAFFSFLSLLLAYPIGAFVDRHNPIRVTIIVSLLLLPTILSYFFFYHTYTFGLWMELFRMPLGHTVTIAAVPMMVLLYPRAKYGQMSSANALVRQAVQALAGIFGAILMDHLTRKSLNTDEYRYGYIFEFIAHLLSVSLLIWVFLLWKKMGGPNYVPPGEVPLPAAEANEVSVVE